MAQCGKIGTVLTISFGMLQGSGMAQNDGWFKPGAANTRLGGRPKGFKGVSRMILEQTGDGKELVAYAIRIWRNAEGAHTEQQRWQAFEWLSDRGLGKPTLDVTLSADIDVRGAIVGAINVEALPALERDAFEAMLVRMLEPGTDAPTVIDVPSDSDGPPDPDSGPVGQ